MCLQFALVNAASCVLHRSTSRVIHRLEWYLFSRLQINFIYTNYQHRLEVMVGGIPAYAH